jgi:hypothetical protein
VEVAREKVHALILVGWTTILIEEVKDGLNMPLHLWTQMPGFGEVQHMEDLHIGQALTVIEKSLREAAGSSYSMSQDYEVSTLYGSLHCLESGGRMVSEVLLPGSVHWLCSYRRIRKGSSVVLGMLHPSTLRDLHASNFELRRRSLPKVSILLFSHNRRTYMQPTRVALRYNDFKWSFCIPIFFFTCKWSNLRMIDAQSNIARWMKLYWSLG